MRKVRTRKTEGKVCECRRGIEGKYANYFKVGYNAFEFVIDFGQNYSENEDAELSTRIILAPVFARALNESLQDSIKKYEKKYGKIQDSMFDENKGGDRKDNRVRV